MLQRLIAAVLGVLGLLAIGLGVASSTVWRGDDILVATAAPDAHLVVADPGVLELAGSQVTVTVHAANDTPVVIAVGRDTDVAGWVGTDAHARVTGLAGWHALRTAVVAEPAPAPTASAAASEPVASEPAASEPAGSDASTTATGAGAGGATTSVADPTGSDLWVAQATGTGTATLTWDAQPGRWSLLVTSLGEPSPAIELAWPRTVTTPWLWPGVVGGAILLLIGLGLGARLWLRARRGLTEPEWHPVLTGAIPAVASAGTGGVSADATQTVVLTRRQMREAEAAHGSASRRRDRGASDAPPTGAQPLLVPGAGRGATVTAPARAGDAPAVAGAPAPVSGSAPASRSALADVQLAARREAGRGSADPRVEREPNRAESATAAPSVDDSRTHPGAPVPPHAAPHHTRAAQPTSTAALPSYFQRPTAPVAARHASGAPAAARGWVPGATQPGSPTPGPGADPGMPRPPSAHGDARSGTAVGGGADRHLPPHPTWAAGRPVIPDVPTGESSDEPPGARADAWRRTWGFPGRDAGGADDAAGANDEGTHR